MAGPVRRQLPTPARTSMSSVACGVPRSTRRRGEATAVGAWVTGATGMFTYFSAVSDGTQNASIDYTVDLSPGTWSLKFFGYQGPGLGIATIKLDGATIGTIDLYAAAPAAYDSTITGITVSTDGAQTLQVVMATKNASSSGYQGTPHGSRCGGRHDRCRGQHADRLG